MCAKKEMIRYARTHTNALPDAQSLCARVHYHWIDCNIARSVVIRQFALHGCTELAARTVSEVARHQGALHRFRFGHDCVVSLYDRIRLWELCRSF